MSGSEVKKSGTDASGRSAESVAISQLETLSRNDPGGRGLSSTAPRGLLEPAARALLPADRIVIVTGFCVRSAMIGETDGPPGAASLAAALHRLGKRVRILTDRHSAQLASAALAAHGLQGWVREPGQEAGGKDASPAPDQGPDLIVVDQLPDDEQAAAAACREVADIFRPGLILAVERPGSASDGHRYSMRGTILDDIAPSADLLFREPETRPWKTLAIGDGGNELGMGSLKAACAGSVAMGEQIFCTAGADYPVAAGISNWGAYALAGAVSVLSGKPVLSSPEDELSALRAVFEAGGVDGCTREHSPTVDGLSADDYLHIIGQIHAIAGTTGPTPK